MDKDTFFHSYLLVKGVAEMVEEHLFGEFKRDTYDLIDAIDDAIQELNSWKQSVKPMRAKDFRNAIIKAGLVGEDFSKPTCKHDWVKRVYSSKTNKIKSECTKCGMVKE